MTPPVPGTEKIASRTLDVLYRNDLNVNMISKAVLPPSHASSEDVKLLINILNPKYIVPVIGEYRHQYALRNLVEELGYQSDNVIMLDNGQIAEFNNHNLINSKDKIVVGDILVDGILDSDVSDVVLRDRELLSQDGVLLVIANIDARKKEVIGEIEVVSRGFVYMKDNDELIDGVKTVFHSVSKSELSTKYINWRTYKNNLRDQISKNLYKETKRRPIIIPVLIDTQM